MDNKKYVVIPEQFRMPEMPTHKPGYCSECGGQTTFGECGHFMDVRDHYGPFERVNWMFERGAFDQDAYLAWVGENWTQIRYVQEHPKEFAKPSYPDGAAGNIPFLARMVEE